MNRKTKEIKKPDVINPRTGESWLYSDAVKKHFFNPKNLQIEEPEAQKFDAEGVIGSPGCGDVMKMWVKIDSETEKIKDLKWRTFGCAAAIAATSVYSVMITEKNGLTIDKALKITPLDVIKRLGGIPERKIHCSVIADKTFKKAINNYFRKTGQFDRIVSDGSEIVDARLNISKRDIEEAVIEGAKTYEDVESRLKVGVGLSEEKKQAIKKLVENLIKKHYAGVGTK
jgi:NifU-like protein involved in Fe-S cluster formation/bacterioferritin-associated ferredoxin